MAGDATVAADGVADGGFACAVFVAVTFVVGVSVTEGMLAKGVLVAAASVGGTNTGVSVAGLAGMLDGIAGAAKGSTWMLQASMAKSRSRPADIRVKFLDIQPLIQSWRKIPLKRIRICSGVDVCHAVFVPDRRQAGARGSINQHRPGVAAIGGGIHVEVVVSVYGQQPTLLRIYEINDRSVFL